jgi:hypothetical protein
MEMQMDAETIQITLRDTNAILPQYLVIDLWPSREPSWDIAGISIYADPECTVLLADDIHIGALPESSQLSIYGALNAYEHEQT